MKQFDKWNVDLNNIEICKDVRLTILEGKMLIRLIEDFQENDKEFRYEGECMLDGELFSGWDFDKLQSKLEF